ncbi:hypothetical protein AKJ16_DCAP23006, partial [Drosera capensis]
MFLSVVASGETRGFGCTVFAKKKLHICRDVIFPENLEWNWSVSTDGRVTEFVIYDTSSIKAVSSSPVAGAAEPETGGGASASSLAAAEITPSTSSTHSPIQFSESSDNPVSLRDITDIYANTEEVILGDDEDELMMLDFDEPICYREAAADSAWSQAMQKEMESIEKNNTWTLT